MTGIGIERMYAHMEWADRRLLTLMNVSASDASYLHLGQPSDPVPMSRIHAATRLFSHLLAAERIWLLRLRGEDSSMQPIWPELSLEEMDAIAAVNRAGYTNYLDTLGDDGLTREIAYANQSGHPYRTQVGDILIHVAMHGSYHRGQIAMAIRAAGGEPINTDYIAYVRESAGASPDLSYVPNIG